MKLNKRTLEILKNFSTINSNLLISAGSNKIKTIQNGGGILAEAEIAETFEKAVAIYDLNMFLALLGKDEAEFDFADDKVTIIQGTGKSVIRYSPPEHLMDVSKKVSMPPAEVE